MRRASVTLAALLTAGAATPRLAHGDAEEASLHAHGLGGVARVGDPLAGDTDRVAIAGMGFRFTYATSDLFAYEAALGLAQTRTAHYEEVEYSGDTGVLERRTQLVRLSAGVTLRLGVRFIPILHLSVGAQGRRFATGRLLNEAGSALLTIPARSEIDLVATAAAGFDYRISRRWLTGVSAAATHVFDGPAYDAIEGAVHLSYYWYPRWF